MTFVLGLVCGLVLGCCFGVIIMAVVASGDDDRRWIETEKGR